MKLSDLHAGRRWLADYGVDSCLYLHPDPDGLAAGALMARRAAGDVSFVDPFGDHLDRAGPMIIVDQGVRPIQGKAPVLYLDRHDECATINRRSIVISDSRPPAASLLAWRLVDVPGDVTWLAALGVLANGGEAQLAANRLFPSIPDLRRLIALCRAPTLLRDGPVKAAFAMLQTSASARDALSSREASLLLHVHETVRHHAQSAARTPPAMLSTAALIEVDVPADIQSQVAAAWARRLSPRPVLVANRGWHAHEVAYAIRGADSANLAHWLDLINSPGFRGRRGKDPLYSRDGTLTPSAYDRFTASIRRT